MARRQLSCLHPEGLPVPLVLVVVVVVADFEVVRVCTEARMLVLTEELEWPMVEIDPDGSDEKMSVTLRTDVDVELTLPRIGSAVNKSPPEGVPEDEDTEECTSVGMSVELLREEDLAVVSMPYQIY